MQAFALYCSLVYNQTLRACKDRLWRLASCYLDVIHIAIV
jgi:hypothetical protein